MDGWVATGGKNDQAAVFSYETAFSRNLGWVTEWEQQALRGKRVAIAGMGGVGGFHLLTLARFGIGAFTIADRDVFELVNFNRQAGATLAAIGRPKVAVMAESAWQINPELKIDCFGEGITEANLDAFLAGADLVIDGLDFFVLPIRRKLNARCRELGIPVINAAPLGMSVGYLVFTPDGMSFEDWFRLDGLSEEQQYVSYLVGMAPSALHRGYLVDPSRVDLRGHRGPSTVAGCELCAAVASAEAIKLLLRRGRVRAAPYYHQFDAYRGRWVVRKLRGGNAHPLQRVKIALTRRVAAKLSRQAPAPVAEPRKLSEIEEILNHARWAPSGDNIQPWRFEIVDDDRVIVHLTDSAGEDPYDYRDGEPTLLSGGCLLESMRIAASFWGRGCSWQYQGRDGHTHRITVAMPREAGIEPDPLYSYVPLRSVDRRPYRLRKLTAAQKQALEAALGPDLEIEWYETLAQRWRMARLGAKATAIRLTTPELFPIHQRVLDWENRYSPTGIPAAAAGIWRANLPLMRWAMRSWERMRRLNALGGVLAGALQMDYTPSLYAAAFFTIRHGARAPRPDSALSILQAGQAVMRFWLNAAALGLAIQPAMATLIFADYGESRPGTRELETDSRFRRRTAALAEQTGKVIGTPIADMVFMGRLGTSVGAAKRERSVRRPQENLLIGNGLATGSAGNAAVEVFARQPQGAENG